MCHPWERSLSLPLGLLTEGGCIRRLKIHSKSRLPVPVPQGSNWKSISPLHTRLASGEHRCAILRGRLPPTHSSLYDEPEWCGNQPRREKWRNRCTGKENRLVGGRRRAQAHILGHRQPLGGSTSLDQRRSKATINAEPSQTKGAGPRKHEYEIRKRRGHQQQTKAEAPTAYGQLEPQKRMTISFATIIALSSPVHGQSS